MAERCESGRRELRVGGARCGDGGGMLDEEAAEAMLDDEVAAVLGEEAAETLLSEEATMLDKKAVEADERSRWRWFERRRRRWCERMRSELRGK